MKTLGRYTPFKLLQRLDQILTWSSWNEPAPSLSSGLERLTAVKKYLLFVLATTRWGPWPLFYTVLTKGFTISNPSSVSLKCISVSYCSGVSESHDLKVIPLKCDDHVFQSLCLPVSSGKQNSHFRNCQQADTAQPFVILHFPDSTWTPPFPIPSFNKTPSHFCEKSEWSSVFFLLSVLTE